MTKHHSLMDSILQRPSQKYAEPSAARAPSNLPNASAKPDSILAGNMFASNGSLAHGSYSQAPSASGRSNSRFSLFRKKDKTPSMSGGSVFGGASVMSGGSSMAQTDVGRSRKGRWWESPSKNKYSSRPPSVAGSVFSEPDAAAGPPGFPHLPAAGSYSKSAPRYASSDYGGPSSRIRHSSNPTQPTKGSMNTMRRDAGVAPLGQQQPNLMRKTSASKTTTLANGSVTSPNRVASPDLSRPVSPAASMGRTRSQSRLAQSGKGVGAGSDWNSFVKSMSGTEVAKTWESMPTLAPKQSKSSLKRSSMVADRIKKELQQEAQYEQIQRDQGIVHQDLLARAASQVIGLPPASPPPQSPPLRLQPGQLVRPIVAPSPPTSSTQHYSDPNAHYTDPNAHAPIPVQQPAPAPVTAPLPLQPVYQAPPEPVYMQTAPVPTFAPVAQAPPVQPVPQPAPVQQPAPVVQKEMAPAPAPAPTTATYLAQRVEEDQSEDESEESEDSDEEEELTSSEEGGVSRQTLDVVAEEDEEVSSIGHGFNAHKEMRSLGPKKGKTLSRKYGDYAAVPVRSAPLPKSEASTQTLDELPASASGPAITITPIPVVVPSTEHTDVSSDDEEAVEPAVVPAVVPAAVPVEPVAIEREIAEPAAAPAADPVTPEKQITRPPLVSRMSTASGYETAASGQSSPAYETDTDDADDTTIASTERPLSDRSGQSSLSGDSELRSQSRAEQDRLRQMDVGEDFFGPSIANILDKFNTINYSDTTISRAAGLESSDAPASQPIRESTLQDGTGGERAMYEVRQQRAEATANGAANKRNSTGTDVAPSFAAMWLLNQSGSDTPAGEEVPVLNGAGLAASSLATPASKYASEYSQVPRVLATDAPAKPVESVLDRPRPKPLRPKQQEDDGASEDEIEKQVSNVAAPVPVQPVAAAVEVEKEAETAVEPVAHPAEIEKEAEVVPVSTLR